MKNYVIAIDLGGTNIKVAVIKDEKKILRKITLATVKYKNKEALIKGLFNGFEIFDRRGVDGAVNGVASVVTGSGKALRKAQTGQLQLYGLFIGIGVAAIVICVYLFG